MKKSINEAAKLKRLAGLITESEYQEEMMNTEAKSSVSKEDKIQVIKEWIWFTCDEGQAKDDINKYNKMVDMYFTSKDDVTKEDFKNIWNKVSEVWGVGDVGADSEGFPETWRDVQRGKLVNPSMKYEGKVKEGLPVEDPRVEQIIQTLKDLDVDGETMEYIIKSVGMDDQMANQLVHNKAEYQSSQMNEEKEKEEGFGGINENALRNSFLSPEAYDRMSGLSNTRAQQAMIKAAEIMMNDLTAEGFEVEEIREFFHILIANDI